MKQPRSCWQIAVGEKPKPAEPVVSDDPFEHPDAQRRFQQVSDEQELELALDFPWSKWAIFLHPTQRKIVERNFDGPFRVSGTAGTGKTVVAIHRAVFLARNNPDARVLLTTFSDTLADFLRSGVRRLIRNEPRLIETPGSHRNSSNMRPTLQGAVRCRENCDTGEGSKVPG